MTSAGCLRQNKLFHKASCRAPFWRSFKPFAIFFNVGRHYGAKIKLGLLQCLHLLNEMTKGLKAQDGAQHDTLWNSLLFRDDLWMSLLWKVKFWYYFNNEDRDKVTGCFPEIEQRQDAGWKTIKFRWRQYSACNEWTWRGQLESRPGPQEPRGDKENQYSTK